MELMNLGFVFQNIKGKDLDFNIWVNKNQDTATQVLYEWYNDQPFIPKKLENYYYVETDGSIMETLNRGLARDYGFITMGNCFRTGKGAYAHKNSMMDKYRAINDGKYFN